MRVPNGWFYASLALFGALTLVACGRALEKPMVASATTAPLSFDVIIRGGKVFDGSGADGVLADVGIRADRVVEVGDLAGQKALTEIDATGKVVAPGFINVLSWATDSLVLDGRGLSDLYQGVTLEIFGEGWSQGPLNAQMRLDAERAMTDENRYKIRWNTLAEYLQFLQRKGVAANVASFVGASTVRIHVLGNVKRKATPEELKTMQDLVASAMQEGALGVGSALIYTPGTYADTEELIALAQTASQYGGSYISHMRSEGNQFLESLDELIAIAKAANIHAEVYHLKAAGVANWPKMQLAIDRINAARAAGIDVSANMYTYTAGATGLDASMPTWVQEGGFEAWRTRLLDPKIRAQVRAEMQRNDAGFENLRLIAGSADNVLLLGFINPALRKYVGKTLAQVSTERKTAVEDTVIDLVIEDGSRVETAYFLMQEDNVKLGLQQPWVSLGSDGESIAPEGFALKSNPHPRTYGNFARFWQRYVIGEKLMSEAQAIYRLTGLPAKNFKLKDRGCLRVGCFADIAVFAPTAIAEHTTFTKPHALASGMDYVLVNGKTVLAQGRFTGVKSGVAVWGPGRVEGAQVTSESAPEALNWVRPDLVDLGISLAKNVCGDATPVHVELRKSVYDQNVSERLETHHCESGESQILVSPTTSDPSGLAIYVVVRSAAYPLPDSLRVGASAAKLSDFLGEPASRTSDQLRYVLSESNDELLISVRDGVIIEVKWQFYTG